VWDGIAANRAFDGGFCGENDYETSSDNIILLGFGAALADPKARPLKLMRM
jgi:hypothetical protein